MRKLTSALVLGIALTQTACIPEYLRPFKDRRGPVPTGEIPSKEALVKYLNDNSGRVQSVRSNDILLTCYYGIMPPIGLTAKMVCEKPRNLRLAAYHPAGSTEVDLGSNNQEFWWWIKRGDPYQYFCSYKDLDEGRVKAVLFPFQPEWIMEAMGVADYGSADQYVGVTADRDNTIRLVKRTRSPQGRSVLKVIVFNRTQTNVSQGIAQVVRHELIDEATKQPLVSAQITKVQVDPVQGGVLPKVMSLRWPAAKLTMTMTFDKLAVNTAVPQSAFVREPINGIQQMDLSRFAPSSGMQRVQGRGP
jgi:hypothetical protein